jgi:hypothetical protein
LLLKSKNPLSRRAHSESGFLICGDASGNLIVKLFPLFAFAFSLLSCAEGEQQVWRFQVVCGRLEVHAQKTQSLSHFHSINLNETGT